VDGVPASYLVDGQGGLPTLVDDGSKAYLHADGVLGEIGGGTRYALGDALGSVRGLADESGSLVGTASYEAFGAPRTSSGASSLFGFTGEPADATGLVYLRARTLDPATGRFLSADTVIPNAPGTTGYNPYAYAGNDPTTWTDPTGHQIVDQDVLREMLWTFVQAFAQNPELIKGVAATLIGLAATAVGDPRIRIAVAIIGMLVVAAYFLSFSYRYPEGGSGSSGGKTEWTSDELEQAQNSPQEPPPPVPPGTSTGGDGCNQGRIDTALRRQHVEESHTWQGLAANPQQKSVFFDGVDWELLVHEAESVLAVPDPRPGFEDACVRVRDAGWPVGVERRTGLPTSLYSVITQRNDAQLISAYPGTPPAFDATRTP
jgi:RHS repeat-associated protein